MSYSIPSSNKILSLTTAPILSISVGALFVSVNLSWCQECIFYCAPRKKRYTLLPEGTDIHSTAQSSKRFKSLPVSNYYGKVIVELENTQSDQEALWNSHLFFISVNIWAIFSLRDCQQITFIMLNRFCSLSKLSPPPLPLLMNKAKLDGIPSKIKWKMHVFWYIVFQVLKLFLIKKYQIELVNQFLYLLFYITPAFT